MIYEPAEFWALADARDGRKYKYPLIKSISLDIDRFPTRGPGRNGGGYILVCENCGSAKWVNTNDRKFCCKKCQRAYNLENKFPPIKRDKATWERINPPTDMDVERQPKGMVTRKCPRCRDTFKVHVKDIRRGRGIYCCYKCGIYSRGLEPVYLICNNCGGKYKAVNYELFCCSECSTEFWNRHGSYKNAQPTCADPNDKQKYETAARCFKYIEKKYQKFGKTPIFSAAEVRTVPIKEDHDI